MVLLRICVHMLSKVQIWLFAVYLLWPYYELEDVSDIISEFHQQKKPIGLCCIAPLIISKVLPRVSVTFGQNVSDPKWPYSGTCQVAASFGATVVNKNVSTMWAVLIHRKRKPTLIWRTRLWQLLPICVTRILLLFKIV